MEKIFWVSVVLGECTCPPKHFPFHLLDSLDGYSPLGLMSDLDSSRLLGEVEWTRCSR